MIGFGDIGVGLDGSLDSGLLVILGLALFAGIAALSFPQILKGLRSRRHLAQRLQRVSHLKDNGSGMQALSAIREAPEERFGIISHLVARYIPRKDALRKRLERTGLAMPMGTYGLICLTVAGAVTGIRVMLFDLPMIFTILLGIASGIGLPHIVVGFLIKRRISKFTSQFSDAIELILRGLRSGLPVAESINAVGREFSDPIGTEFRKISDSVRLGRTLEEALWEAVEKLDTTEFRFFAICLSVQQETGGNLSEALENLGDVLRKRKQMGLKISAMSSEAKASALILGSLPFIIGVLLYLVSGSYVEPLFSDPRGVLMLVCGFMSLGLGVVVMAKMVKFEI